MKTLIDVDLWLAIDTLLLRDSPHSKGRTPQHGRPRRAYRNRVRATHGQFLVLGAGRALMRLRRDCWCRLLDWQAASVWAQVYQVLLARLAHAQRLDLKRAAIDSRSMAAKRGGQDTNHNPGDRGRPGTKHHELIAAGGFRSPRF